MPPSSSFETEEGLAKESKLVRIVGPAVFLNVISGAMLFSARQAVAGKILKDPKKLASFMTRMASAGALMEFLVSRRKCCVCVCVCVEPRFRPRPLCVNVLVEL